MPARRCRLGLVTVWVACCRAERASHTCMYVQIRVYVIG
eukprot:SAG11_NODE_3229_length_2596_cov_1.746496_5_plen_38_part_01